VRLAVAPVMALVVLGAAAACGGDGDETTPAAPASLEGTAWVLASGVDVDGWEAVAPSATFAEGRFSGSTSCNRFTTSYSADGGALDLGEIAVTAMACPPPADAVEREYTDALERVSGWRTEDGELVLVDADEDEVLRYRATTPTGSWEAIAILQGDAVVSTLSGTEVTASFAEDGTLSGSAGCNTYRTTYTTDRDGIQIGTPASTKKACVEPEGVMEQEAAFLAALPTAARYEVAGPTLDLLTDAGTIVATFTRAPTP
jgi:heat shock protein HslJ